MLLRVWAFLVVFALGLTAGCAGKSKTTRGLGSEQGEAGEGTAAGTTASAGGSEEGSGASSTSGGSGGTSSGSGGTSVSEGGTGAAAASPECVAYRQASVLDACNELAPCAATLSEYLELLRSLGQLGSAESRMGCDLVSIVTQDPDLPATELTFDAQGTLVGYFISESKKSGPCDDYKYVRGTQIDASCDPVRRCVVDVAATGAENLCSCPCPDPSPADGVAVTSAACALPLTRGEVCLPTSDEQHAVMVGVEPASPRWTRECSFDVSVFYDETRCYYDDGGALVGIRREDPTSQQCPGVRAWITEGTPACAPTP